MMGCIVLRAVTFQFLRRPSYYTYIPTQDHFKIQNKEDQKARREVGSNSKKR